VDSFNPDMFTQTSIIQERQRPMEYAGIFRRFIAIIIDGFITGLLTNGISYAAMFLWRNLAPGQLEEMQAALANSDPNNFSFAILMPYMDIVMIVSILSIVVVWLYFAGFESSGMQGTPGKLAMGIKVTDTDGDPIGFGMATGRYLGRIISGLLLDLGYVFAFFTSKKQTLHDLIAGTIVILR
jgi:uncharacterized RDD family membrane protein YckC